MILKTVGPARQRHLLSPGRGTLGEELVRLSLPMGRSLDPVQGPLLFSVAEKHLLTWIDGASGVYAFVSGHQGSEMIDVV